MGRQGTGRGRTQWRPSSSAESRAASPQSARSRRSGVALMMEVSIYVAQRTAAALPSEIRQLFENDPIADREGQEWWAKWGSATMEMTLPARTFHGRRRRRGRENMTDAERRGGEWADMRRPARQPQRTRLAEGRLSLLFDPGSKINMFGENAAPLEFDETSRKAIG